MKTATVINMGVDTFTLLDLLRKAAAYKDLKLREDASKAYSKPFKVYTLNDKLLAVLAEQGIKRQDRSDCNNEIFTLVDENPQKKIWGWAPSNYWNFKLLKERTFDLRVSLSIDFEINQEKRGVVFWPQTHGTFVSPADQLPNFRMFKALADNDENAQAVAKELAASNGSIVITWTDLGLGGIRKLTNLFAEFAGRNETIARLAENGEVFNPVPYPKYQQPRDELFVTEPAQPKVIQLWREQLKEYRNNLTA